MVWHEITVHLPLTLLESAYNFLWPYVNGITRGIVIHRCSVTEIQGQFDIILANLYGFLLAEIAPSLVRLLAPAGQLVLGGMAVPHDDEVTAIYQHYGLKEQVRYRDEERGTAVLQKV